MKVLSKKLTALVLTFVFILNTVVVYGNPAPEFTAEGVLIVEQNTGAVMYSKNAEQKMYPASTTKLLTSLVVMDYFSMDDIITVGSEINEVPYNSSVAGVSNGEVITVENLFRGLLLASGNEIACVFALNVAKKAKNTNSLTYSEAEKIFAELMNEKAKSIGAVNSNFVNPHGYHDSNHYVTAKDLMTITLEFLKNPEFAAIVSQPNYEGYGADKETTSGLIFKHSWLNSNRLISSVTYGYEYATGVKTGYTDEAGKCLVASAQKDGIKLVTVLLNSTEEGRWRDAQKAFDWGFNNFEFRTVYEEGDLLESVSVSDNSFDMTKKINIAVGEDISGFIMKNAQIEKEIVYDEEHNMSEEGQNLRLSAPIEKGEVVGKILLKSYGEIVAEGTVVASEGIDIDLNDNKLLYERALEKIKKAEMIKLIILGVIAFAVLIVLIVIIVFIRKIFTRKRRYNNKLKGSYYSKRY